MANEGVVSMEGGGGCVVYTTGVIDESKLRREARKRVRAPAVQVLISKRPVRIPKRVGRPPKALKAQREAEAAAAALAAAAANAAKSRKRTSPPTATTGDHGSKPGKGSANAAAAAAAPASASSPPTKKMKTTATTSTQVAGASSSISAAAAAAAASPSSVRAASPITSENSRDSKDRRPRCCAFTGGLRHSDGESKSDGAGAAPEVRAHERHCCVVGGTAEKLECGKSACAGQKQMLCCGVGRSDVHDRRAEFVDAATPAPLSPYHSIERGAPESSSMVSACRQALSSSSCYCCSRCCCCSRPCLTTGCSRSSSSSSAAPPSAPSGPSAPSCLSPSPPQSVSSYAPLPRFDSIGSSSNCSENFAAYSPDSIFGFATQANSRTVSALDQGGSFPPAFAFGAFECAADVNNAAADPNNAAATRSSGLGPSSSIRVVEAQPPPPPPPPSATSTLSAWPIGLPHPCCSDINCSNYAMNGGGGGGGNVRRSSYDGGERLMTLPSSRMKCKEEQGALSTNPLEKQQKQEEEVKCSAAAIRNQQPPKSSLVTACDSFPPPRFISQFAADIPVVDFAISSSSSTRRSGVCAVDADGGGILRRLPVDGDTVKKESESTDSIMKNLNVRISSSSSESAAMNRVQGCFPQMGGRSESVRGFGVPLDLLEQHQQRLFYLKRGFVCRQEDKWEAGPAAAAAKTANNSVVALGASKAKVTAAVDLSEASDGSAQSALTGTASVDTSSLARRRSSSVEVNTENIRRKLQGDSAAMEDIDEYTCTASGPAPMSECASSPRLDAGRVVRITYDEESWPSNLELEREWILNCHVDGGEANKLTSDIGSFSNEGGRPLVIRSSREEDRAFACAGGSRCLIIGEDYGRAVQVAGALGELSHVSESSGLYDSQSMQCLFGGGDGSTFCSGLTDQNVEALLLPEDIGEILDELELPSLEVPDSQFSGLGSQPSAVKKEEKEEKEEKGEKEEEPLLNKTELPSSPAVFPMDMVGMMQDDGLLSDWLADDSVSAYCLNMGGECDMYTLDDIL